MPTSEIEAERQNALARYEIVDTPAEECFNRFVHIAAQALRMPIALVSFVDSKRQWLKAKQGIDLQWTLREHAFCDHTIRSDDVFVVNDALQDRRFCDNPGYRANGILPRPEPRLRPARSALRQKKMAARRGRQGFEIGSERRRT